MVLLTAVLYFTAVYLGIKMKLRVLAKHLVGPPGECSASPTSGSTPWPTGSSTSSSIDHEDSALRPAAARARPSPNVCSSNPKYILG